MRFQFRCHTVKEIGFAVVYTKEAETADQYIERTVHEIGRKHNVTVATSDGLEQIIIMGQGAARISARGFKDEIASAKQQMREEWQERRDNMNVMILEGFLRMALHTVGIKYQDQNAALDPLIIA